MNPHVSISIFYTYYPLGNHIWYTVAYFPTPCLMDYYEANPNYIISLVTFQ